MPRIKPQTLKNTNFFWARQFPNQFLVHHLPGTSRRYQHWGGGGAVVLFLSCFVLFLSCFSSCFCRLVFVLFLSSVVLFLSCFSSCFCRLVVVLFFLVFFCLVLLSSCFCFVVLFLSCFSSCFCRLVVVLFLFCRLVLSSFLSLSKFTERNRYLEIGIAVN